MIIFVIFAGQIRHVPEPFLEGLHHHHHHCPGILIESMQHSRAMSVNSETSSPQPPSQGSRTVKLSDVISWKEA